MGFFRPSKLSRLQELRSENWHLGGIQQFAAFLDRKSGWRIKEIASHDLLHPYPSQLYDADWATGDGKDYTNLMILLGLFEEELERHEALPLSKNILNVPQPPPDPQDFGSTGGPSQSDFGSTGGPSQSSMACISHWWAWMSQNLFGKPQDVVKMKNLFGKPQDVVKMKNLFGKPQDVVKMKNLLGNQEDVVVVPAEMVETFSISLRAEIDVANRMAQEFFEEAGAQIIKPRIIKPPDAVRYWPEIPRPEELTLDSADEALRKVLKACSAKLTDHTQLNTGIPTYWFLVFQIIRQSDLPDPLAYKVFDKAVKDSCRWNLEQVESALRGAHDILAKSRTWPLLGAAGRSLLNAMWSLQYKSQPPIFFPLFWTLGSGDDDWIEWLFSVVVYNAIGVQLPLKFQEFSDAMGQLPEESVFYGFKIKEVAVAAHRLRHEPPVSCALKDIPYFLWRVNFVHFTSDVKLFAKGFVRSPSKRALPQTASKLFGPLVVAVARKLFARVCGSRHGGDTNARSGRHKRVKRHKKRRSKREKKRYLKESKAFVGRSAGKPRSHQRRP